MKDFGRRLIGFLIAMIVLFCLIFFSHHSWVCYAVPAIGTAVAIIAVWEYEQLARVKGGRTLFYVLAPSTAAIVLSFFAAAQWPVWQHLSLLVFFLCFLSLFAFHFPKQEGAVVDLAVSLFGLIYIAVPLGMILGILYLPDGGDGRWWLAYLLAVTKITDVSGYFVGSLWGRRKLAPLISPKKTVEGAVSGWILAIGTSVLFHFIGEWTGSFSLSLNASLFLGAILGLTSQFGDLSESLLKRDASKKDSNNLPVFGGMLDMVDSLLFNAVILYIYLF